MRFVLGFFAAIFSFFPANAAIIKGKVVDASTGEAMIGATVEAAGGKGCVTDFEGQFEIDCKTGEILTFKYVAYKTLSLPATEGMIVRLTPDGKMLEEVTTTARTRKDVDSSILMATRNSLTVQTGISAQQIQRTQDKDASEVMRRVPGISIIDNRFVMVRGLSQRYNNVWLNGGAMPSSEADSRAFSFDIVPGSQIDNIMIVKSPSPEYPADFSGGFILVNTKNILESNSLTINIGGTINDKTHFRNFHSAKGSATDFLGFDNGMRNFNGGIDGLLKNAGNDVGNSVNLSGNGFNNDWTVNTSTPIADPSLGLSLTRFRRTASNARLGLLGAINYSLSSRSVTEMENSLFGAYDTEHNQSNYLRRSVDNQYTTDARLGAMLNLIFINPNANHTFEFKNIFNQLGKERYTVRNGITAQSDPEHSAEYYYSSRATYNTQFTGKHILHNNDNVNWSAGYSYADKNTPDRRRYQQLDDTRDGTYGLTGGNDINREYTLLKEHVVSLSADYTHVFTGHVIVPTLKAGAYGEYRTRDYRTRSFIYGSIPQSLRYSDLSVTLSDESLMSDNNMYMIEEVKWRNNYNGHNTLLAAFASVNVPIGDFDIYAGARFEHNRMELVSNTRDNEKSPVSNYYTYNDIYPSVNTTYRIDEKNQLRLAYGETTNRPEFREVSSSVYYDFDLAGNVQGNANLKACYIHNLDFRYEFYPSKTEQVTVALFYKHFKNPIEWTYTVTGGTDPVYSYKNAAGAYSYGVELDIKKSLDFIGLGDLSLVFNGALIKSKVSFDTDDMESDRAMQGQSPYLINAGLFYSSDRLGLNATLLYNRIGKRIVGVGRSMGSSNDNVRIPDSYEMPRNAIDFNVAKKFGGRFEVRLAVKDLLAEKIVFKQFEDSIVLNDGTKKNVEQVTRRYSPGRNFSLTLSYKF